MSVPAVEGESLESSWAPSMATEAAVASTPCAARFASSAPLAWAATKVVEMACAESGAVTVNMTTVSSVDWSRRLSNTKIVTETRSPSKSAAMDAAMASFCWRAVAESIPWRVSVPVAISTKVGLAVVFGDVGLSEGAGNGAAVGLPGATVGFKDGFADGAPVGRGEGCAVGLGDGAGIGFNVGFDDGSPGVTVGAGIGTLEGDGDGWYTGAGEGTAVGIRVGWGFGTFVGLGVGKGTGA